MAKLRAAQRRVEELTEELEAARGGGDNQPGTIYVLPKQKKLKTFSGTDEIPVTTFVEDAKAAVKVRKLVGHEAADFILSHLEGAARQEIKHQPAVVATDPDRVCQVLLDTFGQRRSMGSLMREICSTVQQEGESVAEFAFNLMNLADKLRDIPGAPDSGQTIKEQFRDGLLDSFLRREVKRLMKEDPRATFINVRDWAMDMAEEEFDKPKRFTRKKVTAFGSQVSETQLLSALDNLSLAIQGQAKVLENIQTQQGDLQSRVEKLETRDNRGRQSRRGPPRDRSQVECFRCHERGHYASECPSPSPVPTTSQGN